MDFSFKVCMKFSDSPLKPWAYVIKIALLSLNSLTQLIYTIFRKFVEFKVGPGKFYTASDFFFFARIKILINWINFIKDQG